MKENSGNNTTQPHEKIAALARQLWELDGQQPGRDLEYWLKAEQQIMADPKSPKASANHPEKSQRWPFRAKANASR